MQPTLSISLAAYDGYEMPQALDSVASLEAGHVEVAYIASGASFDASPFAASSARKISGWLRASGLDCNVVCADTHLADPEALTCLQRWLDFTAEVGAAMLVVPTTQHRSHRRALAHLQAVSDQVMSLGLQMAVATAGATDAKNGDDALSLWTQARLPWLGLDFQTSQALLAQSKDGVSGQFIALQQHCTHVRLSDWRNQNGWFPVSLGEGDVGCDRLLQAIAKQPVMLSLDLPLRSYYNRAGEIRRAPYRLPIPDIEAALSNSLAFVSEHVTFQSFH